MDITRATFNTFCKFEMQYRAIDSDDPTIVLDDIFNTALCICLRGTERKEEFEKLQVGILRIRNYIFSERYSIETAIVNASKAAYLATLLRLSINEATKYNGDYSSLANVTITSLPTKLNKLKKTSSEAFFYWVEIERAINKIGPI